MKPTTVGELLHWSYANLAMAHAAVDKKAGKYSQVHFMIRSRLFKGLQAGTMRIGPLADDERLKMILPQACCYCAGEDHLAADHLFPRKKGGAHSGDNLVWACRSCNSSKGATDALEWLARKATFPSLLLLRRYLKLAVEVTEERGLMAAAIEAAPALPFALEHIPRTYPAPSGLRLWVLDLPLAKGSGP